MVPAAPSRCHPRPRGVIPSVTRLNPEENTVSKKTTQKKPDRTTPAITGPTSKSKSPLEGPVVAKSKKPKQGTLPHVEAKTPPKVEAAVLAYQEIRDERMDWTQKETAAYAKMLATITDAAMDAKQPFSFLRDDGKRVKVFPEMKPEEFKVRVKIVDEDGE